MTDKFPRATDEPGSMKYAKGLQKPIPKGWKDIVVGPPEKDARTFPEWKDDPRFQHCPFNHHNGLPFCLEHTTREVKRLTVEAGKKKATPLTKAECWANVFPRPSAGQVTFLEYFEHEGQVWDMVRKYIAVLKRDVGLHQGKPFPGPDIAHILEGFFATTRDDTRSAPQWCGIGPSAWMFEAMEVKGDRHEPSTWLCHPFRKFATGGYHAYFAVPNGCAHPPVPESLVPGALICRQHKTRAGQDHFDTVIRPLAGGKYESIGCNESHAVCKSVKSLTNGGDKKVTCVVHWWEPAIRYLRRKGKGGEKYVPKTIPCEAHTYKSWLLGDFSGQLIVGGEWASCAKITKKGIAAELKKAEGDPNAAPGQGSKKEPTHAEIVWKGKTLIWQDVANAAMWPEVGYNWAHGIVSKGQKNFGKDVVNGLIEMHQTIGGKEFKNHSAELLEEIRATCFERLAEFEGNCWQGFVNPYKDRKNGPPAAPGAATAALSTDPAAPKGGSTYEIEPRHAPKLRVDIAGASDKNGTKIHFWDRNGSKAQKFKVTTVDGAYYVFEPLCAPGKAIDNAATGKHPCHLWDSSNNGNQNQHFQLESTGDGYFVVIARTKGGHRWDCEQAKTTKGGKLYTWSNGGKMEHQQFKFNLVGGAASVSSPTTPSKSALPPAVSASPPPQKAQEAPKKGEVKKGLAVTKSDLAQDRGDHLPDIHRKSPSPGKK